MSWPWSHSSDPSRRPILNPRLKAKTRGKRPQKRAVTSAPNRNQPFLGPSIQWTSLGILISSLWEKAHALDKLRNIQISSPIIQDFFLNDKSRSSTGVAFAPLVFFLALGLVLDAWLKPVLETTLDVPGLLASLTSGTGRPKGLCSAFDGSRMISIRLTHIYLSILNIYSYSYNIYILYILYIYIY